MATDAMATDVRVGRKATKCERGFVDNEGNVHARAFPEVKAVRLFFVESETELLMHLDELPEGILRAAAAFGLNTSVGNTFGALADPDEALEVAESRWETLKAGHWSAERATGPRTSDLLEACVRYYQAQGREVSEQDKEKLTAKLADPAAVKELSANPHIAVHVAAIRKERAEERARKASEKAGAAEVKPLDLL